MANRDDPTSSLSLMVGEQHSQLRITQGNGITLEHQLAFGTQAITPGPFRHDPPSPLELEQAIMVVEDLLMALAPQIPAHTSLTLSSPVALASELGGHQLSRAEIERIFGQFAAMVAGDPLAAAYLPRTGAFAAVLLILREWMHHLDVEEVVLAD